MITRDELRTVVARSDPVIVELGANDGEQTEVFLDLFPQARVYAVEPDPRALARFRDRIKDDMRVQLTEGAIGPLDGRAPFYQSSGWPNAAMQAQLPNGWDLSGSLRQPTGHLGMHPWCTFPETIEVAVWTLDSWSAERSIDAIDFMWADVQGAEDAVIAGGPRTLARTKFFYTEYSDQPLYGGQVTLADLQRMLPRFRLVRRYENDALFQRI